MKIIPQNGFIKDGLEIDDRGTQRWWKNGLLHREDGPAVIYLDGYESWYLNGESHRIDGPAVIGPNDCYEWYFNNEHHRLDGPAVKNEYGELWYYHDQYIECASQEEFERLIKLKMFW
jgi:hypothetical protein